MPSKLARVRALTKDRFWFYRPELWWHGPATLSPLAFGHDEYARRTIVLGWSITGRIVIATRYCGDEECYTDALDDYENVPAHK